MHAYAQSLNCNNMIIYKQMILCSCKYLYTFLIVFIDSLLDYFDENIRESQTLCKRSRMMKFNNIYYKLPGHHPLIPLLQSNIHIQTPLTSGSVSQNNMNILF